VTISPYVARLRTAVGHAVLLLPSVAVLPLDASGRVLLVRQSDHGQWATIGGVIELDEDPRAAAVREASEEAGVVIAVEALLGVFGGPEFRVRYPNDDESAYVTAVFEASITAGTPHPDYDETSDVRWFDSRDLRDADLHQTATAILQRVGRLRNAV
jgi:8-oxo-dGTP pyrophosphatase MutT (NUDIX family)